MTTLDDVFSDDIIIPATDGFRLAATLYLPRGARHGAVLINSATAVPRKIYRGFANYLAQRGSVVLTYDYRGIGGSLPRLPASSGRRHPLVGFEANMTDWAAKDITAAVSWMQQRYPALPLGYVGHSFGGQALGLLPNNDAVSRALLIAAQAGYWRLMASPESYRVFVLLNLIVAPAAHLLGYAPGALGIGEDLPKGVFLQWLRWIMRERYLFDDRSLIGLANFPLFQAPLRALCFTDDPWATRPAVELLCAGFEAIEPQIIDIAPEQVGVPAIGHLGFFRPEHRDTLWRSAADWLERRD